MSWNEAFQKTLFEGYASMDLQLREVVACMACTVVIAFYIYAVYRMVSRNAFYQKSFNLSLVSLAVITAAVILTIQSNIVVSLGMVGALSIVRFRTAIKDPMDLVFLFWAISDGIICGAGFAVIAAVSSAVLTAVIFVFSRLPDVRQPQVLLVSAGSLEEEEKILAELDLACKRYDVRSRNVTKDRLDLAVEVRTEKERELLKGLMRLSGVTSASLVSQDGEVTF